MYSTWVPLCFVLCSIQYVLSCVDNCIQFGEDLEPKIKDHEPEDMGDDD